MGKRLKELCEWVESTGYSSNSWIGGDWHIPLHLLSKLLAKDLEERRKDAELDSESDVKISFDSMLQLAEDTFGIPVLITERDLLVRFPNIHLALLTYLVCTKCTIEHFDAKQIRSQHAPRLVFEAKNGMDASLPQCPSCKEHVLIIDRIIVEKAVWHRQCFKCTECERVLARGAFKKGKHGFECITHAVRRILDAHDSNSGSGSGTYDRYGGKSPRPAVAPPPRPKPKLPPKPSYLSTRVDIYETLDEYQKEQQPMSTRDTYDSIEEKKEEHKENQEKEEERNGEEEKDINSPSISVEDSSSGDNSSCDSGVVLRMAKMFSGEDGVVKKNGTVRASQPQLPITPVAPPRPKRTSMLLTTGGKTLPRSVSPNTSVSSRSSTLSRPEKTGGWSSPSLNENRPNCNLDLEEYPNYLCPFGEDDEEQEGPSEYPESKNPFADSDDERAPAPRSLPPPPPVLPGTSDRPKAAPPPPPPGAQIELSTPPPKPPRGHVNENKLHTLKISRKKHRAPLPPVPQLRKINFTEKGEVEEPAMIKSRLSYIDDQMSRIEVEGRALEKEMLFQIATNPSTWMKSPKADDWVQILTKKLELMREQLYLLALWRETYLNEVHSETEYYIRCLLEKEKQDKSEWELEREATLTSLLIYIIDEKLKLDECLADMQNDADGPNQKSDKKDKETQKKSKLRKRVAMIKKKLKSTKKDPQ